MGFSIGGSRQSSSGSTNVTPDPYFTQRFDPAWNAAFGLLNRPFEPYTGPKTAPLSALENQAIERAQGSLGAGKTQMQAAADAAERVARYAPLDVAAPVIEPSASRAAAMARSFGYRPTAGEAAQAGPAAQARAARIGRRSVREADDGRIDADRLTSLQNPNLTGVVDASLDNLDRARRMSITGQAGEFTRNNAFGGSRQGVADALTNAGYLREAGKLSAQMRADAFDRAASLAQGEAGRRQQGTIANLQADLEVAGRNAGFDQETALASASARDRAGQYDAGLRQQTLLANRAAADEAARLGAAGRNTASLQNAQFMNDRGQFNATLAQQAALENARQALAARQSNQAAGLQGANLGLEAAGLLGTLGQREQEMGLLDVNTLMGLGAAARGVDQAGMDAQLAEFLRRVQDPYTRAQAWTGLLGALPRLTDEQTKGKSSGFSAHASWKP